MKWMKWGLAAVGVVVAGGIVATGVLSGGGSSVQAQTAATPTPAATATPTKPTTTTLGKSDKPDAALVSRYETLLAQMLGISVATLQADQKSVWGQAVDEAVAAGKITPLQAAQLKKLDGPEIKGKVLSRVEKLRKAAGHVIDAAAQTIGISKTDVKTDLQKGQSLAQIAQAQGVSRADLKTGITGAVKAQLDAAVKSSVLTPTQETDLLNKLAVNIDTLIDRTGSKHGASGQKS